MLKTEQRVIDGIQYTLTQLPAMSAQRLLHKVIVALGPAVAELGSHLRGAGNRLENLDLAVVGRVIGALTVRMDEQAYQKFIEDILSSLQGNDQNLAPTGSAFAQEFAGKTMTVLRLLWWGLELNFADFFSGLRSLIPPEAKPSESPAPLPRPGIPGVS